METSNTNQFNAMTRIMVQENVLSKTDDASVIQFVDHILAQATKIGASDIHFETYQDTYRIRCRQDGLLNIIATPPLHMAAKISTRLKILANLDISEKRLPQDGRFHFLNEKSYTHARLSTCPTIFGEKIVVRLLDPFLTTHNIENLGFDDQQKTCFLNAITRPQGMIIVTGPTGSGKTMTLYSALNILNTQERNIYTAEDPVEVQIQGINQVNAQHKNGLNFAQILRAFLRQDPDVIMVGEIRDLETADIAIKASLTGHLVLSTLHTNSAAQTISRLINMGIAPFYLANAVTLIVAQRLVRRLCSKCKIHRLDSNINNNLEGYQAMGCTHCHNGYKGRLALFEILPISKEISQLILSNSHASDIHHRACLLGMQTLYQAGLKQVALGQTTLEEVQQILMD